MPRAQTKKMKKHRVIGKLFATWCSHCTTLAPEWKKMKREVKKKSKNDDIKFVEIESENMESGLEQFNRRFNTNVKLQSGYPTLFKVDSGNKKVEYYNGNREAMALTKWSMMAMGKKQNKTMKRW